MRSREEDTKIHSMEVTKNLYQARIIVDIGNSQTVEHARSWVDAFIHVCKSGYLSFTLVTE